VFEIGLILVQVATLLLLAAVCSGLNVSLMSLSVADLKRKAKIGDKRAARVLPLRTNSHLSLAGILFTNVAANTAVAIFLNQYLIGLIAGFISTILLVLFAEILPQAIFTKNSLTLVSNLAWLIRLMIIITYPLSKPTQLLLDRLFGDEKVTLHSRRELNALVAEHQTNKSTEIDKDELEIIQGALALSEKRVTNIMTPINEVFWLTSETLIDEKMLDVIKERHFSRIPIFNKKLTKCYGILLMKDLIDIDFDHFPQTVSKLSLYTTKVVGSKTVLDTMFRRFIAARTHMMPVEKNDHIVGIVTIEDLIEEIIGHEIEDESDHLKNK
jgi:metal transporter CNNM